MKMKDSGIDWIGIVPEGWEMRPFKSLYELGKGLPITKEDLVENGTPVVSYGQIHSKSNIGVSLGNELLRYVSSEYLRTHSQCILSLGDIAIADTSEDLEGCGNSVLMNRDEPVFAGYHTIIAKKRNDSNSKFLAYVFLSENWRSQIRSTVHGVKLFSITKQILSQTSFPIPPLSEQKAIANYLDEKCGKIDEQVKLLEKKVEAYKNLKSSIINETVTRGLDKNVKLKDSGVDWIGMVPEGWEVKRVESCIYEVVVKNNPVRTTNLLSLIKDVGVIPYSEKGLVGNKEKLDYSEYKVAYPNTIVANSMNILIGSVGLCNYEGCVSPVYYVFKTNALCNIKYINYLFSTRAFQKELRKYANGILEIRLRVSASDILKCEVPLPCLEEQQAIATYLDEKCSKIDKAIELVEKQIDAYKRLKRSLINEVVTGKRRVE